jgi:hypothetical protein
MRSTRIKVLMEKRLLGINSLLLPNYKKHFKAKKNTKEMDFQIHKFMLFFCPPYHALTPY